MDLGRGPVPVEVGIQTTPGGEGNEERRLTPAKGICPKQERGGELLWRWWCWWEGILEG